MPEMSVQLIILKRLTNHLAGMTEAGGYGFDMAGRVFRGRTLMGPSDPIPMLTILEAPESANGVPGGVERMVRQVKWRLFVQGFVNDDKSNPLDPAYMLKAYTEQRLSEIVAEKQNGRPEFPDLFRLGGLISDLVIENGVVRPPQKDVSDKAFFWLPIVISYTHDAREPVAQVTDADNP